MCKSLVIVEKESQGWRCLLGGQECEFEAAIIEGRKSMDP